MNQRTGLCSLDETSYWGRWLTLLKTTWTRLPIMFEFQMVLWQVVWLMWCKRWEMHFHSNTKYLTCANCWYKLSQHYKTINHKWRQVLIQISKKKCLLAMFDWGLEVFFCHSIPFGTLVWNVYYGMYKYQTCLSILNKYPKECG